MSDRINYIIDIVEVPKADVDSKFKMIPYLHRPRVFFMGDCRIITTQEPEWHLSISCADRDPTYDELVTARYRLLPERPLMAMLFPPQKEFVNLHPHTFHLFEVAPKELA